jgi:hypothetical protein
MFFVELAFPLASGKFMSIDLKQLKYFLAVAEEKALAVQPNGYISRNRHSASKS